MRRETYETRREEKREIVTAHQIKHRQNKKSKDNPFARGGLGAECEKRKRERERERELHVPVV